jgi:putative endonuclease
VHFAYIVRCSDGTLYTGYARDPQARAKVHNSGRGARYTSGRRPVRLVYAETFASRSDALKREHQLKRLTRAGKEALIAARRGRRGSSPTTDYRP